MTTENLPAKPDAEHREYIQIQPATNTISAGTVTSQLKRLHSLCRESDGGGLLSRLFGDGIGWSGRSGPASIEWLLVSPGTETEAVHYFVTIGDQDASRLDALEDTLRLMFPNTYELSRTTDALGAVDEHLVLAGQPHTTDEYPSVASVEFVGEAQRRRDWQTQLAAYGSRNERHETYRQDDEYGAQSSRNRNSDRSLSRSPLTTLVETMATTPLPMIYQVLVRPLPNWRGTADSRVWDLKTGSDTLIDELLGSVEENETLSSAIRQRIAEIENRDTAHSFTVNARIAVLAPEGKRERAERTVRQFRSAFDHVSGEFYTVRGRTYTDSEAERVRADIRERRFYARDYERMRTRLPMLANTSRGIVVDRHEFPHFCLLDGATLTPDAERALEATPDSQTTLARPPAGLLEQFDTSGMVLGRPVTTDGAVDDSIALPPDLQPLHTAWIGGTGSGKSTALITAMLENAAATAGADILIDPKGGQMPEEYLHSHYARFGTLDNVLYFDLAEWVPALSFFDISDELAAGVPRSVAVEDRIGHYEELLEQFIGREQYRRAIRSPDIITNMLRALYDPVHGDNALTQRQLHGALERLHTRETIPAVSDEDLERRFESMVANANSRTFDDVMHGAKNRVEKLGSVPQLEPIFNNTPDDGTPVFDLAEYLDKDVTIILDTGRLRRTAKRGLTLVLLSNLWTALRRRRRRQPDVDLPLINVYLEEAASIAKSELLDRLLAQGREFGVAMTLSMQFPGQLETEGADTRTYAELLNNIGTYVTGAVGVDHDLAHRFATDAMDAEAVGKRLRSLSRGEWLVDLPGEFFQTKPQPFILESVPLPRGHPERTDSAPRGYERQRKQLVQRTRAESSLSLTRETVETVGSDEADEKDAGDEEKLLEGETLPSIFSLTERTPDPVRYDEASETLVCQSCESRYASTLAGMRSVITCCHSFASIDRDDVPVCRYHLKRSPEEITASEWSLRQLAFVQVVYNAQQLLYDPLEYDIVHDSMIRLKEFVGIDQESIDELVDANVLRYDGDHPHRLYSVTSEGRDAIGETFRLGVDFGHLQGDLDESSQHVCAVEAKRRQLEAEYVADPDSPVEQVETYYEVDEDGLPVAAFMAADPEGVGEEFEQRRLDLVGLDAAGEIVLTVEVERINNDIRRAVPEDFDKMAACDPEEAHWVVLTQSDAHDVIEALHDPLEGEPRVGETYRRTTPPYQLGIDTPGMTEIRSFRRIRKQLDGPSLA